MNSDYTVLPFFDYALSAKLLMVTLIVIAAIVVIKAIIYNRSLSLHRAPVAIVFSYVMIFCINFMFCTFLYWYWALPICLIMSFIYAFTTAREVKEANSQERIGVYGLNKEIQRIRGELFNDMPIEDQLRYREAVKETSFSKTLFIIIAMTVPVISVLIFHFLNIGYLFFPVII